VARRACTVVASIALAFAVWAPATAQVRSRVPVQGYEVVRTYPHDPQAFTEGLVYRDGQLLESTGRFPSDIRIVRLEDGVVLKKRVLDTAYFGEGIVDVGDRIVSLTWRNRIGFVWDGDDLTPRGAFSYTGEGWALTRDETHIIMSDGTPTLRFLDPETLAETGRITVTDQGVPVDELNELEWIDGQVWANIWHSDRIARIDPATGHVVAWVDLSGLRPAITRLDEEAVLNGIAWDAEGRRLFVTGKNWPSLFEIRVVDAATP